MRTAFVAMPAMALALAFACVDFDKAEQRFCSERPGECPTSPPAPRNLTVSGVFEPCHFVTADAGGWLPEELPPAVRTDWYTCADAGAATDDCTLVSELSDGFTIDLARVGSFLRAKLTATSDAGVRVYEVTGGPVVANAEHAALADFLTGFEQGTIEGTTLSPYGTWEVVGQGQRSGNFAAVAPTSESFQVLRFYFPGASTYTSVTMQFAFMSDRAPAGPVVLAAMLAGTPEVERAVFRLNGTTLEAAIQSSAPSEVSAASSQTIAPGAWYVVRAQYSTSGPTGLSWRVDGMAQPPVSGTGTSAPIRVVDLGHDTAGPAARVAYDDYVLGASLDFAEPDGRILPMVPEATGVHDDRGDFALTLDDGATQAAVDGGFDYDTWDAINDWPVTRGTSADAVMQRVGDTGAYLEWELSDLPEELTPAAARLVWAMRANGTPDTAEVSGHAADDHGVDLLFVDPVGLDQNLDYPWAMATHALNAARDAKWTTCSANALKARFGYSMTAVSYPRLDAFQAEMLVYPLGAETF